MKKARARTEGRRKEKGKRRNPEKDYSEKDLNAKNIRRNKLKCETSNQKRTQIHSYATKIL